MKKDEKIKTDVRAELEWGSRLSGSVINTEVNNGVVTLSGHVDSYPKKVNIVKAIERIGNVTSVINLLEVKLPLISYRTDRDIERSVSASIKWNTDIDEVRIVCKVQNGVVILEGDVEWEFQRSKAGLLAGDITGVTDVKNLVSVSSYGTPLGMQKNLNSVFFKNTHQFRPGV